jgi:hypothetical protein
MEQLTPEMGVKVAACLRQYRSMKAELETAQVKLASADKERAEIAHELEAHKALVDGIQDGTIDPDDCEEKLAELKEDPVVKTAAQQPVVSEAVTSLGHVEQEGVTVEGEGDPLTNFLLGQT